ncbi:Bax inhibitor-1 family protein [Sphingobacterium sp. E70]|nr:Bax inhibitor-1 family protein [Sphingobacterium sp. E70]
MDISAESSDPVSWTGILHCIEAIIFLPIIFIAASMTDGAGLLYQASIMTLALFTALTAVAFMSNKDFSFLKNILVIGGFLALGAIVAGALFGFQLGLWFSIIMVLIASGSILYQTQSLKYNYGNEQYVGAALQLFSSIMLLFWYILRILMSRR